MDYDDGRWNNTLCPVCGRWMKVELEMKNMMLVKLWYCTNPKHMYTGE